MSTMQPPGAAVAPAPAHPEAVVPLTAVHPVARVDLMPAEHRDRHRFRLLRAWLGLAIAVTVLACAGVLVLSWRDAQTAAGELAGAQDRTTALQAEAGRFADVPAVLGSIERTRTSLDVAMTTDVAWADVLADVARTAPESVWFEQVTFTVTQDGVAVTDPLATPGTVASVTMNGRALRHEDVTLWLDAMADLAMWEDPVFTESVTGADDEALTFTTTARFSAEVLTGRYTPAGNGPGSGAGTGQ